MDQLSSLGIVFALAILGLGCLMAKKLASKKAYH